MHDTSWQDIIIFTLDQLLVGNGWHEIEKDGQTFFRWSGPDTTSTIHINPRRDHGNRLNLTIHTSADEDLLSDFNMEADGLPLYTTVSRKRSPAFITAVLPADKLKRKDEQTILTLKLPHTLPAKQVLANPLDARKLGLAISRIDVFPLSRSVFTAQKYNDPTPFDGLNYIRQNPEVRDAVINGAYASAYDYFVQHGRTGTEASFELHEKFDECPGDLYDILQADMRKECRKLEKRFQEEMDLLRNMLYGQGDRIREMMRKNVDSGRD
jgi:hypothetical protein